MNKFKLFTIALTLVLCQSIHAAITIRYQNKDSKDLVIKFTLDGSSKEVTFDGSKTSSVTIQGSATKCYLETSCGKVEIKDGDKIEIKDGCIKIN